jgi:Na+-driven multidrug efflux pump
MSISLIGGVVNVFLDWVLIAQLDMGTAGAAIASGIGYSIPGIAGVLYFAFARKGTLYFVKPKWNGKVLLKTITNGSSEMVALVASGITTIAMNNIMMRLRGEDGVAAISILLFTMTLLSDLYMGYALGVAPITSYNLGADHKDKLKQEHKINLKIIGICSVVMYLLGMLLKNLLICIYADKGTAVYEIAAEGYWLFSIGFLYMGFNLYASSFFTSLGEGKASALVSFYRGLVFLIVALYGMSSLFGVTGLYLAVPVAEFLGLGSTAYFMKKLKSKYHYA